MEVTFKKEEINHLEEQNKKLLLHLQRAEKLNRTIERTIYIAKSFSCVVLAGMVAVSIIPEGRFIALITASLLLIPAAIISYTFH